MKHKYKVYLLSGVVYEILAESYHEFAKNFMNIVNLEEDLNIEKVLLYVKSMNKWVECGKMGL